METSARIGTKLKIPVGTGTNAPMTRVNGEEVIQAMVETGGNKGAAARLLGCSSTSIMRGMIAADLETNRGTIGRPPIPSEAIAAALATANGNTAAAARILGCSVRPIYKFKHAQRDQARSEDRFAAAIREHGSIRRAALALGVGKSTVHRHLAALAVQAQVA